MGGKRSDHILRSTLVFELADIFDGLESATVDVFWELNAFDDDYGYRNISQIAESMGISEKQAKLALAPLVDLDWVDFSDDLLTEDGESFGAGYALYEDGLRIREIYEVLQSGENHLLARCRARQTEPLANTVWHKARDLMAKLPEFDPDKPDEASGSIAVRAWEYRLLKSAFSATEPLTDAGWLPIDAWDKRDELVFLLVDYADGDHPLEDARVGFTIGHNNDHNVGPGEGEGWEFAGWCWCHDHFTQGKGRVVGWRPIPPSFLGDKSDLAAALTGAGGGG